MSRKLLFIAGALATKKLWHMQASLFSKKWQIDYLELGSTPCITGIAQKNALRVTDKCSIVAFSMGGYVALDLIELIPEKIEKLILINSAARELCQRGKDERQRSISLVENGKFNYLIEHIFVNSVHKPTNSPKIIHFLKEMAQEVGATHYRAQLQAMIDKPDQSFILDKIQCPLLLIAGRQDKVMPNERSQHIAAHVKHAELVYLDECGHMAMLEQTKLVNNILSNWL